jgi:V/A-type H+-transporting ATPase subunit C
MSTPGITRSEAYLAARVAFLAQQLMDDATVGALIERPLAQIPRLEGFARLLERQTKGQARSRAIENALIGTLLSELSVVLRAMRGEVRDFFQFWARRFELLNLKTLIRGKLHGLDPGTIEDNLYNLPPYTRMPLAQLLQAESISELLKLLEPSPYGDIARQARLAFEDRHEALYLDATIDRRYFGGLVKRVERLDERHRSPLRRLIRGLVDHQNLVWLLRYRFAYGLGPAETYFILVPQGLRLDRELLQRLCSLPDFRAVIEALPPALHDALGNARSAVQVERALERRLCHEAWKQLHHASSAPARAFAYLVLREVDLKRTQVLIQGKMLGLPPELVREALGLAEAEAEPLSQRRAS